MDTMSYLLGKNASGGGGSVDNNIFVVKGTYRSGTYTIDKTYQEINEAYEQNKILLLVLDEYTIFLSHVYDLEAEEPEYMFQGHGIIVFNNKLYSDTINIKRVEGFTMTTEEYTLTPSS